jgi:hypothetical protein
MRTKTCGFWAYMLVTSLLMVCMAVTLAGCGSGKSSTTPVSSAGIQQTRATIPVGADGLTVEQRNVKKRLEMDNKPGSIKHLYVFSSYSGQCLLYSTVDGKVSSSGKRLSPYSVAPLDGRSNHVEAGFPVNIGGKTHYTAEVLQDDGTYGNSVEWLLTYWPL